MEELLRRKKAEAAEREKAVVDKNAKREEDSSAVGDKNGRSEKDSSAVVDKNAKREKDSSAVGDKNARSEKESSAVGDKNARASPLDLSQLGWLGDVSVFAPGSKLWRALEARCWNSKESVDGYGGDFVFCDVSFDDLQTEASQRKHFEFWTIQLKTFVNDSPVSQSSRLLRKVPPRPGRFPFPHYDMLGFLAKYNWQFRRPFPQDRNVALDTWRKVAAEFLYADQVIFVLAICIALTLTTFARHSFGNKTMSTGRRCGRLPVR